jgi:DNA invertase Pin-like site-specific DNA recombinase
MGDAMKSDGAKGAAAFGYVRVSTIAQVTEGEGLAIQRERIGAWCAYQGIACAAVEADEGVSGASTDNRPGLRRALRAALEHGSGAALIVYKLDRLGRSAIDVQETLAVLLDAGVRVVALADGVDSGSGMGATILKLLTGILATFAELEKETIRERLQGGRRHAKAHGRTYSREPSYGLRSVEGSKALAPDAGEAAAVERIRALRAERMSYRGICAALTAEGIAPRHGGTWGPGVVQRLASGTRAPAPRKASKRIAAARLAILSDSV